MHYVKREYENGEIRFAPSHPMQNENSTLYHRYLDEQNKPYYLKTKKSFEEKQICPLPSNICDHDLRRAKRFFVFNLVLTIIGFACFWYG